MINIFRFIFFALVISLFAVSCGNSSDTKPHYTNGFRYDDQEYQNKVLTELKNNQIPVIVTDEGFITYPNSHNDRVREILIAMDNRPYSEFYKRKYAENFAKLLKEKQIAFDIKHLENNKVQVYWNKEDDNLVRELEANNLKAIFEKQEQGSKRTGVNGAKHDN